MSIETIDFFQTETQEIDIAKHARVLGKNIDEVTTRIYNMVFNDSSYLGVILGEEYCNMIPVFCDEPFSKTKKLAKAVMVNGEPMIELSCGCLYSFKERDLVLNGKKVRKCKSAKHNKEDFYGAIQSEIKGKFLTKLRVMGHFVGEKPAELIVLADVSKVIYTDNLRFSVASTFPTNGAMYTLEVDVSGNAFLTKRKIQKVGSQRDFANTSFNIQESKEKQKAISEIIRQNGREVFDIVIKIDKNFVTNIFKEC